MAYRSDGATPRQRFDEKVGPPDENGCRLWLGGSTRSDEKAYGLFYADGQMRPAHRWALEQHLVTFQSISRIVRRESWSHIA